MPRKVPPAPPVLVTRTFLLNLAARIYDPKSKAFLRLCHGTLRNGPDPTNVERHMHCGLGELYVAMTGQEPLKKINEDAVVSLAVQLSPLYKQAEHMLDAARATIEQSGHPNVIKEALHEAINDIDEDDLMAVEDEFREVLGAIPDENDDGCEDGSCTVSTYRARSMRVARQLRKAAMLLPV